MFRFGLGRLGRLSEFIAKLPFLNFEAVDPHLQPPGVFTVLSGVDRLNGQLRLERLQTPGGTFQSIVPRSYQLSRHRFGFRPSLLARLLHHELEPVSFFLVGLGRIHRRRQLRFQAVNPRIGLGQARGQFPALLLNRLRRYLQRRKARLQVTDPHLGVRRLHRQCVTFLTEPMAVSLNFDARRFQAPNMVA